MSISKLQMLVGLGALSLIACQGNAQDPEEQESASGAQTSPSIASTRVAQAVPAGAAQPRQITDLASAVSQTSAVIEGTVSEIHREFSDADGPWTRIVLDGVIRHLGTVSIGQPSGRIELRQFGGLLPSGRMMIAAELPLFVQGQRYLVFLRNTAWNISPIVGDLALRVDAIAGTEVLVNTAGEPVLEVDQGGARFGAAVFEPIRATEPAIVQRSGGLADLASPPLDRRGLLDALGVELEGQGLRVEGPFYEHPAGEFRWRGQAAVPHGQPTSGDGLAGIDTSDLNR